MKAFADNKIKVAKMRISLFDRVEKYVGIFKVVKIRDCVVKSSTPDWLVKDYNGRKSGIMRNYIFCSYGYLDSTKLTKVPKYFVT